VGLGERLSLEQGRCVQNGSRRRRRVGGIEVVGGERMQGGKYPPNASAGGSLLKAKGCSSVPTVNSGSKTNIFGEKL